MSDPIIEKTEDVVTHLRDFISQVETQAYKQGQAEAYKNDKGETRYTIDEIVKQIKKIAVDLSSNQ